MTHGSGLQRNRSMYEKVFRNGQHSLGYCKREEYPNSRHLQIAKELAVFGIFFGIRKLKKALQISVTPFSAESEGFELFTQDPLQGFVIHYYSTYIFK